jgi:hypothetical protein
MSGNKPWQRAFGHRLLMMMACALTPPGGAAGSRCDHALSEGEGLRFDPPTAPKALMAKEAVRCLLPPALASVP